MAYRRGICCPGRLFAIIEETRVKAESHVTGFGGASGKSAADARTEGSRGAIGASYVRLNEP